MIAQKSTKEQSKILPFDIFCLLDIDEGSEEGEDHSLLWASR
jgi:hypothetical protein